MNPEPETDAEALLDANQVESSAYFKQYRRENTRLQVVLGVLSSVLAVATIVLIIVNVHVSNEYRSCPLTYEKEGSAVSEADMRKWAADASWTPLAVPKWNDAKPGCSCEDGSGRTPVWIAPIDLVALYPDADFPPDFPRTAGGVKDHVKVCLEQTKLDRLWKGEDAQGATHFDGAKHCHQEDPFAIYTGWDGDLQCCRFGSGMGICVYNDSD